MKSLVLGGIKSGKSKQAESLATDSGLPVTLIATALPLDAEMEKRIAKHQHSRPDHWQVVEEPYELGKAIEAISGEKTCVLVDCLTLWMTQLLMLEDEDKIKNEIQSFNDAVNRSNSRLILVSNENNMGIVPLGELSRRFCDEIGVLHQVVAAHCDQVILCVAGLPMFVKGSPSGPDAHRESIT